MTELPSSPIPLSNIGPGEQWKRFFGGLILFGLGVALAFGWRAIDGQESAVLALIVPFYFGTLCFLQAFSKV